MYFLQLTDVDDNIKKVMIDLLFCMERIQKKSHTDATVNKLEQDIIRVMAQLETLLPVFWCSITKHVLLHSCEFIRRCGPFSTHVMLTFERWHTVFKKLVRSTHNAMVHSNYFLLIPFFFN